MEKIDMSLDDIIKLNRKVKKKSIAQKKKATAVKKPGLKTQGKIGALRSKYATRGGGVSARKLGQSQSNFSYQSATRQSIKKAKLAALRAKGKQRTQQAAQVQVQRQGAARQSLLAQRRGIQAQVKQLQSKAKQLQNLVEKQQQQIQTQQQFVPETRRKKRNRRFVRQPYQPNNNQNKAFQTQQSYAQQQQQTVQGQKKKRNRRFVRQPQYQTNNQLSTFETQGQQQLSRRQRQKQKRQQLQQQSWLQQNQGWQQQEVSVQKSRRGRRFNRQKGNNANLSAVSGSQLTVSFNRSNRPMQKSRQQNYAGNLNERFGYAQQQLHAFQQQNSNNLYQQQSNKQRGYGGRGRRGWRGGRGGRGGQASRTVVMA